MVPVLTPTDPPVCALCRGPITGRFEVSELAEVFCDAHAALPRCRLCGAPVPGDGRFCRPCAASAVRTQRQVAHRLPGIRRDLRAMGLQLRAPVRVRLVAALAPDGPPDAPDTETLGTTTHVGAEVVDLAVVADLPLPLFGGVVAHECMHAWLVQHGVTRLSAPITEGLCELAAYGWLGRQAEPRAAVLRAQTRSNPDPVYGDGFRAVSVVARRHGVRAVLASLVATGRLPGDDAAPGRTDPASEEETMTAFGRRWGPRAVALGPLLAAALAVPVAAGADPRPDPSAQPAPAPVQLVRLGGTLTEQDVAGLGRRLARNPADVLLLAVDRDLDLRPEAGPALAALVSGEPADRLAVWLRPGGSGQVAIAAGPLLYGLARVRIAKAAVAAGARTEGYSAAAGMGEDFAGRAAARLARKVVDGEWAADQPDPAAYLAAVGVTVAPASPPGATPVTGGPSGRRSGLLRLLGTVAAGLVLLLIVIGVLAVRRGGHRPGRWCGPTLPLRRRPEAVWAPVPLDPAVASPPGPRPPDGSAGAVRHPVSAARPASPVPVPARRGPLRPGPVRWEGVVVEPGLVDIEGRRTEVTWRGSERATPSPGAVVGVAEDIDGNLFAVSVTAVLPSPAPGTGARGGRLR